MFHGTGASGPQAINGKLSFWVMVLIDPTTNGIHSFHACADQNPTDRMYGCIIRDGWTRRVFVLADNIWDAMNQARDKGILMQDG